MLSRALGFLSIAGGRPAGALALLDRLVAVGPLHAARYKRLAREMSRLGSSPQDVVYGEIWRHAAREIGAEVAERPDGSMEVSADGAAVQVRHYAPFDDALTRTRSLDKTRVHRQLAAAGLPVPPHLEFTLGGIEDAHRFLRDTPDAAVVKPASGTGGGAGVTPGVRTQTDLIRAALNAARFDHRLLIERQASGDMYRLLLLDGQLLDVVRRRPPHVIGDGRSSIRELILAENRRRLDARGRASFLLLKMDLDCELRLRAGGYDLRSVPPAGEAVTVKTASSENRREENETLREPPSESLVRDAATAARAADVQLAGVDVVTPDPSMDLRAAGGLLIEVNAPPGLQYHYQVRDPERATRVAVPILRTLLDGARPGTA